MNNVFLSNQETRAVQNAALMCCQQCLASVCTVQVLPKVGASGRTIVAAGKPISKEDVHIA